MWTQKQIRYYRGPGNWGNKINGDSFVGLSIGVPQTLERQLYQVITEIVRRSVDGSLNPIQISVDIKITGGGNGLILPSRNGLHFGRVLLENPYSNGNLVLSVDPLS